MGFASASSYFVLVAEGELHGAMPTLVVGMWWICPRFHHAHDKRGHGTRLSAMSTISALPPPAAAHGAR